MRISSRQKIMVSSLALLFAAAGCSNTGGNGTASTTTAKTGPSVALLLPESKTARYETQDRPFFTTKLKELCPACELTYANANQDASTQLNQADQALTNGADVLVLDPVDAAAAASVVAKAKAKKVPVISYDRLVKNADVDYYVGFDNEQIGRLQAQSLVDKMTTDGTVATGSVIMINGSPTDSNAAAFKRGAHGVFDNVVRVAKEYDTEDWSPDEAKAEMVQAISAVGRSNIAGIYAANDGIAGGAIQALKDAGFTPLPPVTGQDAELSAIQRIVAGEQYSTIYKTFRPEAEQAATIAAAFALGTPLPQTTATLNNGQKNVPSIFLPVVTVTKSNIKDTVIKDNTWTAAQICTGAYASPCSVLGLS